MDKIFKDIDDYLLALENSIMSIVNDQTISMLEKNRLMQPIVDQKKVLIQTKKSLHDIKNRDYEAKCKMSEKVNNDL